MVTVNANVDGFVSYCGTQPQLEYANRLPRSCTDFLPHRGYRFHVPVFSPGLYSLVLTAFAVSIELTSPSKLENPSLTDVVRECNISHAYREVLAGEILEKF